MNRIDKRKETATVGFFILEHEATGKVYTSISTNMQRDILSIKASLEASDKQYVALQSLYKSDPVFIARCSVTDNIKQAKTLERVYRQDKPDHLLI